MDEPQMQFLTIQECTVLEEIGARMLDKMWPEQFTYHTKSGATVTFQLPSKEDK